MSGSAGRFGSLVLAAGLLLSGCAAAGGEAEPTTVGFRLWDAQAADAYRESFAEFERQNPDIRVDVEVIPWSDYWTSLRSDVADGTVDDIFWTNANNYDDYVDAGVLLDIDRALGRDARSGWSEAVVAQYERDGVLWGVPQLDDPGIAMLANIPALLAAGLTPADLGDLRWSPDASEDTLRPLLRSLTLDAAGRTADDPAFDAAATAQYGYNASRDLNAIVLNYLGSNGGAFQEGDRFVFDRPESVEAVEYVVGLVNADRVSPPASETNADLDTSRRLFLEGRMALFQTGVYSLSDVLENARFEWAVVPLPAGPKGRVTVGNGIVAAAVAESEHPVQVRRVLEWMASPEGAGYLGASGAAVPAVLDAQAAYLDFWQTAGIDVRPFFDGQETTVVAPHGSRWLDAEAAFVPLFDSVFLGQVGVAEGLRAARDAAQAAVDEG